jgi:hypothetical protein
MFPFIRATRRAASSPYPMMTSFHIIYIYIYQIHFIIIFPQKTGCFAQFMLFRNFSQKLLQIYHLSNVWHLVKNENYELIFTRFSPVLS